MKRLTEKEQDYYRLKDYQDPCKAIDQLGRYEDIGFSPEELQEMVDRQKWHVVAERDLPPKPEIGMKKYLITKVREQDFRKKWSLNYIGMEMDFTTDYSAARYETF